MTDEARRDIMSLIAVMFFLLCTVIVCVTGMTFQFLNPEFIIKAKTTTQ